MAQSMFERGVWLNPSDGGLSSFGLEGQRQIPLNPKPNLTYLNTTVLLPFSTIRCSTCHRTARASVTHSTSRPIAVN